MALATQGQNIEKRCFAGMASAGMLARRRNFWEIISSQS
jgi:hypothetical protein